MPERHPPISASTGADTRAHADGETLEALGRVLAMRLGWRMLLIDAD